jgi:glycosyltransferase involved in cell wall biosynthesis
MISVVILTMNEERDLPECLASIDFCDDIHVLDSGSTDRTVELARARGAHVSTRAFTGYASQRNAALDLPFRHRWVFLLDADERLNPALWAEALNAVGAADCGVAVEAGAENEIVAFRVRRVDHFLGRPLRFAQMMSLYPRLVRPSCVRYTREVNEFLEIDGAMGELRAPFRHDSFSKGLARWFEKHNMYSSMEARIVAERGFMVDARLRTALFAKDFHARRRAQKAIFYLLPGRPLLRWFWLMFVRGGILDGRAGLVYSTLQAVYEWHIVLKTGELLAQAGEVEPHVSERHGGSLVARCDGAQASLTCTAPGREAP